ncbi:hypothetical protein AVEN_229054-1 [Araneus ventricosus]|uniref:DDE-1 domain-containing protein n=1 Tax=Araneus ventricosus TaxID=182803 RepID=A0A4Y2CX23_ARAVE|nr:hypothetical protein AVEN_229054-1 [Araneus ventricosus]
MAIQNSNLPSSFVNEVVKIVDDETIVRSNLKSVSDVYSWIEEYGRTSDTKWNLRSSRPSGTRTEGSKASWKCHQLSEGEKYHCCVLCIKRFRTLRPTTFFIFPRKRMPSHLEKGELAGAVYRCSENGWSNDEQSEMKLFEKFTKPGADDPVLFVLDNHCSHTALPSYDFCRQQGNHMIFIPSH